jgi:hypothetical protein
MFANVSNAAPIGSRGLRRIRLTLSVSSALTLPGIAHGQTAEINESDLQLEFALGGPGSDYQFHEIRGVAFSSSGELYVLDLLDYSVRVFDTSGKLVRRFGRRGSGPGEFEQPANLTVSEQHVLIEDRALRRVVVFDTRGEVIGSRNLPTPDRTGRRIILDVRPAGTGRFVARDAPLMGSIEGGTVDYHTFLVLTDSAGIVTDTLAEFEQDMGWYWKRGQEQFVNAVPIRFGLAGDWAVSGDSLIAAVDGQQSTLTVFRPSQKSVTQVASIRLPWDPLPTDIRRTEDEAQRMLAERRGGRPAEFAVRLPRFYGQVADITFDDAARIWLQRVNPTTQLPHNEWHMIAWRTGTTLTMRLPRNFVLGAVARRRLAVVVRDDLGVQSIRVYRAAKA